MDSTNILEEIQREINEAFKAQDPELLETVFEIEGKKLYADKLRLSVSSQTFKSMLSKRWNSNKNDAMKITVYKFDDFKEFLSFIHTGKLNITDSNIHDLLDMSEFYGVKIFKNVCEKYLSKMEINLNNIFQIMEATNKYSLVQIKEPIQKFIALNFNELLKYDGFLNASKVFVEEMIFSNFISKPEQKFQAIYQWAEHQAVKSSKESNEKNINKNDAIKAELTSLLPHFEFQKMNTKFLVRYVVKRGFLFSYDELSNILDNFISTETVELTNLNGQSLRGTLPLDSDAAKVIKALTEFSSYSNKFQIWWNTKCKLPSTPTSLKKKDGVEWYLLYFPDGDIGIEHYTHIHGRKYLLAEMTAGPSGFSVTTNCKIEII